MEHNALKELYIDELKDIFDAENQLVKALPKMAKAADIGEASRRIRIASGTNSRSRRAPARDFRSPRRKTHG